MLSVVEDREIVILKKDQKASPMARLEAGRGVDRFPRLALWAGCSLPFTHSLGPLFNYTLC